MSIGKVIGLIIGLLIGFVIGFILASYWNDPGVQAAARTIGEMSELMSRQFYLATYPA